MQPVQATFLDKAIIPGETPIIIVSPGAEMANDMSLLLSLNVITSRNFARLQDDLKAHNHYFSNKASRRILSGIGKAGYSRPAEQRDKIRLLLEESADNGKLWGLQCDYGLFFGLELYNLYEAAYYIFLYDDAAKTDVQHLGFLNRISDFAADHPDSCQLVHLKQVATIPEIVLASLPFKRNNALLLPAFPARDEDEDEDEDDGEEKDLLTGYLNNRPEITPLHAGQVDTRLKTAVHQLDKLNFIARKDHLLKGDRVVLILLFEGDRYLHALIKKLKAVHAAFVFVPELHIICKTEAEKEAIRSALNIPGPDAIAKTIHVSGHWVATVNQAIFESEADIILLDNLHLAPDYAALLQPHQDSAGTVVFSFGSVSAGHIARLTDFLTTHIIQDVLACSKGMWEQLNGFDPALDPAVFLWDFSIRALRDAKGFAAGTPAKAIDAAGNQYNEQQVNTLLHSAAYQQVITRHQHLFEENSQQLIGLFTQYLHLPQHQIKDLHQKISTLQTMQHHSKNELKAVTDLSKALQKRIYTLEDRWHYKLNVKIKRLKKIFFKKNTGGTGRLKKILHFLAFTMSRPGMLIVRKVSKRGLRKMYLMAEDRPVKITYLDEADDNEIRTYDDWIRAQQKPELISNAFKAAQSSWQHQPKISIVMPVYNPLPNYLKQAIESVLKQDYPSWELCIADDCSPGEKVAKLLRAYSMKDSRIKVAFRKENGHISAASNSALGLATGEYILFMDHDDLLSADCLLEVVKHINEFPQNDIIYSDEDKVNEAERHTDPHFKPDWAPDSLLSRNYFGHVVVMKKHIVDAIGGFRLGFEGSQDYDLILRATERTDHIGHIPKVLYHWRIHGKSAAQSEDVKPYAYIAAKKALEEALVRRGTPGAVSYLSGLRGYRIRYDIPHEGKVSIIIPTKDHVRLLKNTVDSILHHTDYKNYEIIVLNNNSSSKEFFSLIAGYNAQYSDRFTCIDANFPFNFSKLMNIGAAAATGEYLLLLNNDVEIIHEDWLRQMVSYAQHRKSGAIGVRLLYPDDHIQHAGVIVGLGGVAGHAFLNSYKDDPGYFNYIQSVNNFSAVTAACMMCRKSVYNEVGGMDEAFEVEYNDVDLCLKFLDAGYYNIYLPDVELYHYESATRGHPHQSRESWDRHVREIKMFKAKWQRYIDNDPFYNPNLNIGVHDFSMSFSAKATVAEQEEV